MPADLTQYADDTLGENIIMEIYLCSRNKHLKYMAQLLTNVHLNTENMLNN